MEEQQQFEDNRRAKEEAHAKLLEETSLYVEAEQRTAASRKKLERKEKEEPNRLEREKQLHISEGPKRRSKESHKRSSSSVETVLDPPIVIKKAVSPPNAVSTEERKTLRYLKIKEKRKSQIGRKRDVKR